MSVPTTTQITSLLDKMTSNDKDFRFMATNDLMTDLQKESIKLDDDSERRIVKGVLKLLEDHNGEVQNQAVKCLGPLVCKVKENQIEVVIDTLCTNIFSNNEQLRDISSIGLKTVINSLALLHTSTMAINISRKIMSRLISFIQRDEQLQGDSYNNATSHSSSYSKTSQQTSKGGSEVSGSNTLIMIGNGGQNQLEILDIISDMLARFGSNLSSFHLQLKQILLNHLNSSRSAVRKRVTNSLSYLLSSCNIQLFNEVLTIILEELKRKPSLAKKTSSSSTVNNNMTKTYIQALTSICRLASQRLSDHMRDVIEITIYYIDNGSNSQQQHDDELIEFSLQAIETYLKRCPKETNEYVAKLINLCLRYIKYDPNWNDQEDEDEDSGNEDEGNDSEQDDKGQDDYSDDDDVSWKVRRAATKCLEAVIITHHEMLNAYYKQIVPVLIERFNEREDTVKGDIFHCFNTILQQTKAYYSHSVANEQLSMDTTDDSMETDIVVDKDRNPIVQLKYYIPAIVKSLSKILKHKNTKNRENAFIVLTNLVHVQHNLLNEYIDVILPNALYSLSTGTITNGKKSTKSDLTNTTLAKTAIHSNLKITALSFLYSLLQSHDDTTKFHKHIKTMLPLIIVYANDTFYKIASEALLVLQQLIKIIRPNESLINQDFKQYVNEIYHCTQKRLKQTDIDQEVKERAIICFAHVIAYLGDLLPVDLLNACWPVLEERLKNEITRLPTVRALTKIIESSLHLDLQPILLQTIPILSSYLRQNHRTLKMSTLTCLTSVVNYYYSTKYLTNELLRTIIIEIPNLVTENDLLISQLALKLITVICIKQQTIDKQTIQLTLTQVLTLIQSPLLQGTVLDSVIEFSQALVPKTIPYKDFVNMFIKPIYQPINTGSAQSSASTITMFGHESQQNSLVVHKQAFYSIAKCFAAVTVKNLNDGQYFINKFQDDLNNQKTSDSIKILALLCLGETGKYTDLAQSSINLQQIILDTFSSSSEELRNAASYALGYIGIRSLDKHIPFILNEITANQSKKQYLLLHSLKEIITYHSHTQNDNYKLLRPYINDIWSALFAHCECSEEGTRNVVAECLGKLTLLEPEKLLPILRESFLKNQAEDKVHIRSTILTAVKFTILDQPQHIDNILRLYIKDFLNALEDSNIHIKRVALVLFNSAAHNKPVLIRDLLKDFLLEKLYNETKVRPELIREVEMGPFKHTVDDGLDLRKAAYECMYTLLDTCLDKLDIFEYLNYVENGLNDHYDVRMLTFLMVIRISVLMPNIVLQRLERLIAPLKKIIDTKIKANSVKQECEKNDELKRAAIKSFLALQQIKDADKSTAVMSFLNFIKGSSEYNQMYEYVQHEQQQQQTIINTSNNTAEMMDLS
ncbi:unnamed protein product [Didymodactylos carnosus]|uniref:TATA-binding protein interacting (TIP20) domain-containing protein n=1 Tax=Didymodactylos carnosus TaxID=1234261 RepID=A0A8S2I4D2_9BILA|nr:unnamed protein product [Didymodactylos carnosus]CAF3711790.1 unnamed protein product [Didymodactylos carnosus]